MSQSKTTQPQPQQQHTPTQRSRSGTTTIQATNRVKTYTPNTKCKRIFHCLVDQRMQDTRGALVHRLQFLNVVQQLARADVESAAAAVGLDALQGVVSLASPRLQAAEGAGRYTGRPASGVHLRDRSSSVTQKTTKIVQTRRHLNTSNHVRSTLSSGLKSIGGGLDDGLKEVIPHSSMGEVVSDDRGRKNPASGMNSRGTLAARSSPSRVSPHDIETLRNIIFGGDYIDSRRKEVTSFSNGRSNLQHTRPEWDNRFGVKQTSGPKVSSKQKHNPLPLSKPLAPLTEDTSGGGCEKAANDNNKPDDQQRVGASILERPPIGPQHSLHSTGGALGSASFSQGGGGSPIAAEGQTSLGNSVGGGGALLNATSSIDEVAAATNRSETPLAGSRARRGSAVKARPRPKAAGGHASGGGAVAAGQALRPSDFSAVDAAQRRLSQLTPMLGSPSPTGLASSAAGVALSSNNPIRSSARGNSLSASGTPGVAAGASYHPLGSTQHLSPSVTPTKSGGALRPASLNASPSNPPLTPLGVEGSTTALASDRGGADSTTNNASTSPLPADALESPSRGSVVRNLRDEELRAAENVRLLALAKAEALQIEQQQRQQQILHHVSSLVENMLSEHTEIVDKQMISIMPRGMHDVLDVDHTFQGRTRRKLRNLEEKQEQDALRIRGKMAEELAVLEYGQNTQQREVAGELELDRVIRRLHEQEFVERAMGERSATDARDDAVSRKQSVLRRHGTGHIPAATINRILKSASESHEVVRYNERLWNTSSTSQYAFCDRLAGLLLEDLLSEIAYEEVDVMLSEYIDGLAAHELQI